MSTRKHISHIKRSAHKFRIEQVSGKFKTYSTSARWIPAFDSGRGAEHQVYYHKLVSNKREKAFKYNRRICSDYYMTISIEKKLKTPSIKNLIKHINISNSCAQYAQHPSQVFTKVPHVYVTSVHTQAIANNQRDASSVWAEEVTTASFKICLRELKNFDGVHRHLRVVNFQQHKTSLKPRTKLSYTNTLGGKRGGG